MADQAAVRSANREERADERGEAASRAEDAAPSVLETERKVGRGLAVGLPLATLVAALGVGLALGVPQALLTMAGGALLGVVVLFWASLRTLSGDAPLSEGLEEALAIRRGWRRSAGVLESPEEKKRRILRALKDLEHEHEVGKIDDADHARIAASYRAEAKAILRAMDVEVDPQRAKAESIARAHLKKKGLLPREDAVTVPGAVDPSAAHRTPVHAARVCRACTTTNDGDAVFCKKCGAKLTETTHAAS